MVSVCNSVRMYHGSLNFVQEIKIKDVIHKTNVARVIDHGVCCLWWVKPWKLFVGVGAVTRVIYLSLPCPCGGSRERRTLFRYHISNSPEKGSTLGASCYKHKARARGGDVQPREKHHPCSFSHGEGCSDNLVEDEIAQSTRSDRIGTLCRHTITHNHSRSNSHTIYNTHDLILNEDHWR